jgi:type IV secretory pathway component VirB8
MNGVDCQYVLALGLNVKLPIEELNVVSLVTSIWSHSVPVKLLFVILVPFGKIVFAVTLLLLSKLFDPVLLRIDCNTSFAVLSSLLQTLSSNTDTMPFNYCSVSPIF